jgi:hypothetical protein
MSPTPNPAEEVEALRAALAAAELARQEAEARATGAEAMVAHLKLLIAKLKHDRFGASSERGRKLIDQLELELSELVAAASEDATKAETSKPRCTSETPRRRPVRAPLPEHLPRERVVIPAPSACPCCGGKLAKLGEDITDTLEVVPRQWKVIQTVREKFSCRSCESITQPPALFHPIARGRAGPQLLAVDVYVDPGGQVRPAPAAEPPERDLRPRGHRAQRLDHRRLGWHLHRHADAADSADRCACAGRGAAAWRRHHRAGAGQGDDPQRSVRTVGADPSDEAALGQVSQGGQDPAGHVG